MRPFVMLLGLVEIVDGLTKVLTLGAWSPRLSTQFLIWRSYRRSERQRRELVRRAVANWKPPSGPNKVVEIHRVTGAQLKAKIERRRLDIAALEPVTHVNVVYAEQAGGGHEVARSAGEAARTFH